MLPINNNRTRLSQLQQQQRKAKSSPPPPALYLPAVYRYTCRGIFTATSEERGSAGHCQGIRSSIEHVIDMDIMTRDEALKSFINADSSIVQGEDDVGLAIEDGRAHSALIYPLAKNNSKNKKNPSSSQGNIVKDDELIDEEDRIVVEPVGGASDLIQVDNKIEHDSWSAFGSTEVECLQLTDVKNGSTEIVALAPYNAALVSTRKIVMDDRSINSMEIGLGPYKMQFVVESIHVGEVDNHESNHDREQEKHSESSVAAATPQQQQLIESVRHYLDQGHEFNGRMYDFSLKMVDQMYHQTVWLKNNLQDDFFARTVASGKRIIDEMPRTVSIFGKAFRSLFGTDNDDHHDD
jgi:hypothetical protein